MTFKRILLAISLMVMITSAQATAPTNEEIWQMLQKMQQQMTEIQQQNQQLKTENEELKDKIEQTEQVALENNEAIENVAVATEEAVQSVSEAASKTTIGSYGELHYNNLDGQDGAKDKKELDFHRFVLTFGHEFNDRLRFFSELELEHALSGEGQNGELELEQAYLEYDFHDQHRISGGIVLLPIGIINETHEPTTFYGVERNQVEKNIIPTTWWEGGVMFSGDLTQGFSYNAAATSGLDTSLKDNYAIRKGRQKVSKAKANDFAYTGRLKWTGIPGVELAGSLNYQENIAQSQDPTAGSAWMWETHAVIQKGDFGFRALYASWDLDGSGPKSVGADQQLGWYLEPSYLITDTIGLFTRYSLWDNQAGNSSDSEYQQWDLGVNWWIDPQVVVKFDYQDQDAPKGKEQDGFNVGLGYWF